MAKAPKIDKETIRELAELLGETGLTEIEVEQDGFRLRVASGVQASHSVAVAAPAPNAPVPAAPAEPQAASEIPGEPVTSPMVGTAYMASAPGAAPFVSVGQTVAKGQTLLIIEAMKTMNQIPSPRSGKVAAILVEDGQPVEFGEQLLTLE